MSEVMWDWCSDVRGTDGTSPCSFLDPDRPKLQVLATLWHNRLSAGS